MTSQLIDTRAANRDTLTTLRVRYIQMVCWISILGIVLGLVLALLRLIQNNDLAVIPALLGRNILFLAAPSILLILLRQRKIDLAALGLVLLLTISAFISESIFLLLGLMAVVTAATLSGRYVYIIVNVIILGWQLVLLTRHMPTGEMSLTPQISNDLIALSTLLVVSIVTRFFVAAAEKAAQEAKRSSDLLQAVTQIGQALSKELSLAEMLNHAVDLIRDRFVFYHVQVFLINDERDQAVLVASTGDVGRRLIERRHQLAVGSQSVVGRATQIGELVLAEDTEKSPLYARNDLLPDTHSELALPVLDGDRIIGALDVQSTRRRAFNPIEVQALQVMANQLGSLIRNARLFEAQADNVQENKRLFFESEANLREIQRLNRQLTKSAWTTYLKDSGSVNAISATQDGLATEAEWTEYMVQASQKRRAITNEQDEKRVMAVPIILRGEVLGAIEIESEAQVREADTVEMVQAVAQRLAVTLDRARLFEEAQETTALEQRINDIVARYQGAGTIDDLLRITLTELSDMIGAQQGAIRLGSLQTQQNGESAP